MVGLGNPGAEFEGTLHNAGADAVTVLGQRDPVDRCGSRRARRPGWRWCALEGHLVALAIPTTYMNESGTAVRSLVTRFGVEEPTSLVVVHDELDLPPGTVRIKVGGGLAGHNGLRSLQAHLHTTDFLRVRIGVGKPPNARAGRRPRAATALRRPPGH